MADKPTYKDIEGLLSDLEKAAAEGKKGEKRPAGSGRLRQTRSTLVPSEATRQVKELEIKAIERMQAREEEKKKEGKKKASVLKKTEEAVRRMIDKYLS